MIQAFNGNPGLARNRTKTKMVTVEELEYCTAFENGERVTRKIEYGEKYWQEMGNVDLKGRGVPVISFGLEVEYTRYREEFRVDEYVRDVTYEVTYEEGVPYSSESKLSHIGPARPTGNSSWKATGYGRTEEITDYRGCVDLFSKLGGSTC